MGDLPESPPRHRLIGKSNYNIQSARLPRLAGINPKHVHGRRGAAVFCVPQARSPEIRQRILFGFLQREPKEFYEWYVLQFAASESKRGGRFLENDLSRYLRTVE